MAPRYNKSLFLAFKHISVQSADELEIGETYYSNSYPKKFILKGLITDAMMDAARSIRREKGDEYMAKTLAGIRMNNPTWFITDKWKLHSLNDLNVGASYNPWLIFDDELIATKCINQLKVTYEDTSYSLNGWLYTTLKARNI